VSDLFLSNVTGVSCERMVGRGAIDILRMRRKVIADRSRKIEFGQVLHGVPNEGSPVRTDLPRISPMNGRISVGQHRLSQQVYIRPLVVRTGCLGAKFMPISDVSVTAPEPGEGDQIDLLVVQVMDKAR
jgi:hypothetical protein